MKCPHCLHLYHPQKFVQTLGADSTGRWAAIYSLCPGCNRQVIEIACAQNFNAGANGSTIGLVYEMRTVVPRTTGRNPPPPEVPAEYSRDYVEACLVLADSPKASAALSRRCLQHILETKAGVKKGSLAQEIDEVIASKGLPSHLSESVDAIRNVGNFAAHLIKSTASGEIVDVEPGEAEWNLDVLEGLLDFYFVQPELTKKRREALNAKLTTAGKPPLK